MNYSNDEPIKSVKDDLLDRGKYAKQLAKALINVDATNGFCVGIYGRWGYGKTSLLNMMLCEIEAELGKKANIIRFNPWVFSSREDLTKQFFSTLIKRLKGKKDDIILKVGDALYDYADALNIKKIPGVKKIGKSFGLFLKRKTIKGKDLQEQKDELSKILLKIENKIIIVIDDIDRLSSEEIKCIFQLVNSVAKLPNIVYVLAFDKKVATKAITEIQKCDGEEYLEKMIQLPIEIPSINQSQISKIIFTSLDKLMNYYKNIKYNKEYWSTIYFTIVSKYILSIRDVNRLYNILNYKLSFIVEDVNFCDLIALTVLETKKT